MGSQGDPGNVEYWATRWVEGKTGWHKNTVNPFLLKHYELVTGEKVPEEPFSPQSEEFKRNSQKKWFIPLCGKTLDIPFLLSLGYQVFAVEGVRQAIEALAQENNLTLEFDEQESIYSGADGRLKIFIGDLFLCPFEKFTPVNYVWDRGSLIAFEYPLRKSYKDAMQRALKNSSGKYYDFVYLLETVQYDKTKFGGPPRCVDDHDIEELYKDWTEVKFLEKEPMPEGSTLRKIPDIGPDTDSRIFLVTPKPSLQ